MSKKKPFKSPKIKCNNCKDVIFSSYPGEWVCCKCWKESTELRDNLMNELQSITTRNFKKEELIGNTSITVNTPLGNKVFDIILKYIPNNGIFINADEYMFRTSGSYKRVRK